VSVARSYAPRVDAADVPTNHERLQRQLIARARTDPEWAQRLRSDPKGAVEDELGVDLPEHLSVLVVQETPSLMCIVLPHHLHGMHPDAASSLYGGRRRSIRHSGSKSSGT
jgi:hypothetical protein